MKKKLTDLTILLLVVCFFFSLFEIYNLSALYKDQVEFPLMATPKNITDDFYWDLVQTATHLTSLISFFQYSALTTPVIILLLIIRRRKGRSGNPGQNSHYASKPGSL